MADGGFGRVGRVGRAVGEEIAARPAARSSVAAAAIAGTEPWRAVVRDSQSITVRSDVPAARRAAVAKGWKVGWRVAGPPGSVRIGALTLTGSERQAIFTPVEVLEDPDEQVAEHDRVKVPVRGLGDPWRGEREVERLPGRRDGCRGRPDVPLVERDLQPPGAASARGHGVDGDDDVLDEAVQAVAGGNVVAEYTVNVRYDNGTGVKSTQSVSVNGATAFSLSYPATAAWNRYLWARFTTTLKAGDNTIAFTHNTGYAELDAIDVYQSGAASYGEFKLVNRNSGVYFEIPNASITAGAQADQWGDTNKGGQAHAATKTAAY